MLEGWKGSYAVNDSDAPTQKNHQIYIYPLLEHFEVWVWKSPIEDRVKLKKSKNIIQSTWEVLYYTQEDLTSFM